MTITILKQEPGQKIPRPFARASSRDELVELLAHWSARTTNLRTFKSEARAMRFAKQIAERAATDPKTHAAALGLKFANLDTDLPIVALDGVKFYAFIFEE